MLIDIESPLPRFTRAVAVSKFAWGGAQLLILIGIWILAFGPRSRETSNRVLGMGALLSFVISQVATLALFAPLYTLANQH